MVDLEIVVRIALKVEELQKGPLIMLHKAMRRHLSGNMSLPSSSTARGHTAWNKLVRQRIQFLVHSKKERETIGKRGYGHHIVESGCGGT